MKKLTIDQATGRCFLCGRDNPIGPGLEFFLDPADPPQIVTRWTPGPEYSGQGTILHGGFQAGLLDEIMGWAAHHLAGRPGVTQTISVDFLCPVHVGRPLEARGRMLSREGPKVHLEAELVDRSGNVCARARGTYHLLDEDRFLRLSHPDKEPADP